MHIFANENPNEIANKLINKSKMQITDTTSKEMRDAIRKAYDDYLAVENCIEALDEANEIFKKATGRPLTGKNEALIDLLLERGILKGAIISRVKEYFQRYSNLETLERYLNGLSGPSAYICALESLTGENFM